MFEVRFHGRGGQGAVMAAQALASAAFQEGNYAVAFPYFGAERRGAPVMAFTRVDKDKIFSKTLIYEPDYIVVLDDKLTGLVDVADGLKDDGMAIINSNAKPEDIELGKSVKCATVDATTVALETLGQPITNSAILGAFAKATGLVSIDSIVAGIMDIFGSRIGEKLAAKNANAAKVAYERTSVGTCKGTMTYEKGGKWLPDYKELPLGLATRPMKTPEGLVGPGSFVDNKTGSWKTFAPVHDPDKCIMCRMCWFYCPDGAIKEVGEGDAKTLEFHLEYCKGCGICANECPKDAIKMER